MTDMLRVYVGYDSRQPLAFQVLIHSIWSRATGPVAITRLDLTQLPMTRRGLTEFTYSRFLVPWLSGFEGHSVFVDSDMLCLGDIRRLVALAYLDRAVNGEAAVWVVKHTRQFERPSVMVFDNERCKALTPAYVDDQATDLFSMAWAERVGDLPGEWNHLVGYDPPNDRAQLIHFTQGIPCWPETGGCEYALHWAKEAEASMATVSFRELMGRSVHPLAQETVGL